VSEDYGDGAEVGGTAAVPMVGCCEKMRWRIAGFGSYAGRDIRHSMVRKRAVRLLADIHSPLLPL